MRKSIYAVLLLAFVLVISPNILWTTPNTNEKKTIEEKKHPLAMSPEKTLRTYLEAFIRRDIDTAMAYLVDHESEKIKKWRERMRALASQYMTDKKHVKSIIDIKFIEFKDVKKGKEAHLEATIETTPKFSGAVKKNDKEKYTATYKWIFWQFRENGPWFFNGGGF